jgi:hypothetical protein
MCDDYADDSSNSHYNRDAEENVDEDPMVVDQNRKRLLMGAHLEGKRDQALPAPAVTDLMNQFQSSNPDILVPPSPPLKMDPKRQKSGNDGYGRGEWEEKWKFSELGGILGGAPPGSMNLLSLNCRGGGNPHFLRQFGI